MQSRNTLMFAAAALAKHGARVAAVQPAADPEAPPPIAKEPPVALRVAKTLMDEAEMIATATRVLGDPKASRPARREAMRTLKKLRFVSADTRLAAFAGLRGGG